MYAMAYVCCFACLYSVHATVAAGTSSSGLILGACALTFLVLPHYSPQASSRSSSNSMSSRSSRILPQRLASTIREQAKRNTRLVDKTASENDSGAEAHRLQFAFVARRPELPKGRGLRSKPSPAKQCAFVSLFLCIEGLSCAELSSRQ